MDKIIGRKVFDLGWRFWFGHNILLFVSLFLLMDGSSYHFAARVAFVAIAIGSAVHGIQRAYIKGLNQGADSKKTLNKASHPIATRPSS